MAGDKKGKGRFNKLLNRYPLVTGLVTAFLVLIVIDLFLGSIEKYHDDKFVSAEEFYRIYSPVYHHGFAPLKHYRNASWGDRKYEIKTNSLGFKDSMPRQVALSSEHHRIVFIGDSFTEGIGVKYEDTFVGIIDREFKKQEIEVFNAAVASYSPTIYYAKIRHLLEHVNFSFDELVVFLDICDVVDECVAYNLTGNGNVIDKEPKKIGPSDELSPVEKLIWNIRDTKRRIKEDFFEHTIIMKTLRKHLQVIPLNKREDKMEYSWTLDKNKLESYGIRGLEIMKERMNMLHDMLKSYGIKLTVAVYPWTYQIQHRDIDSVQVRFWRKWADERRVGFIDFFPYFINNEDAGRVIGKNFIKGDGHWNEDGHRLVAEGFLKYYNNSSPPEK